jgi:hypothetical protein|tara:strand:+ start:653 stop:994 length:342 start_codon:yes stop_codon:yes gene_type:complete
MNSTEYNKGFEDARQGRERQQGQCDEYNRGWAEGQPFRSPAAHIRFMSCGKLDFKQFRQLSGLAPRTIRDWFHNKNYRKRLDCMIAGAVALDTGRGAVVDRIRGIQEQQEQSK